MTAAAAKLREDSQDLLEHMARSASGLRYRRAPPTADPDGLAPTRSPNKFLPSDNFGRSLVVGTA